MTRFSASGVRRRIVLATPLGAALGGRLPWMVVALLLATGSAAACAGTRRPADSTEAAPGPKVAVAIEVENTESPGRPVSVELVSSTGDRVLLGSVGPRRTETFHPAELSTGNSYSLVAGLTGGGDVRSERFTLTPGATIRWTLPFNTLHITQ